MGEITSGKHRAVAVAWMFGTASTGTNQIAVSFQLLDVEGNPQITWYGAFTDAANEITIKSLRAMGWHGADLTELDNNGGGLDLNEVQLVLEEEEYDGDVRMKVKWVNALGLGMKNPLAGNDLKAFAAQMKAKILALDPNNAVKHAASKKPPARNGTSRPPPTDDGPPPHTDDDIPF